MTLPIDLASPVFCVFAVATPWISLDGRALLLCTSAPTWSSEMSLILRHLRQCHELRGESAYTTSGSGDPHRCLYKRLRWARCHVKAS